MDTCPRCGEVSPEFGRLRVAEDQVARLVRAVEGFLDNPGCNARSKQTAMAKLRFAAKAAELALRSAADLPPE